MSKLKWLCAGTFLVVLFSCIGLVLQRQFSVAANPVFRLTYGLEGNPVDGVLQTPIPNKGYLHAAVAADKSGNFYLLSGKQNELAQIPGVPSSVKTDYEQKYIFMQQRIIHVLVIDSKGQVRQTTPLRRLNGSLVRGGCDFLTVSENGERWWTLRQAHESLEDWKDRKEVEKRTVLLNAYNNQGKPLGEWKVPVDLAGETFAVAAIGTEVYIAPENLEKEKQLLVYSVGSAEPKQHSWPGSWLTGIGISFITSNGQFWHLLPSNSGSVQAFATELNKPSILFATFQWQPKGFSPFLFWADDKVGLFVFEHLYEYAPTSTPPRKIRSDGAKAVYKITDDGAVQKLFETQDVLPSKPGYQTQTGQPLKADDHYVWLDAEYLKDGKVTEYQIVKVKYR